MAMRPGTSIMDSLRRKPSINYRSPVVESGLFALRSCPLWERLCPCPSVPCFLFAECCRRSAEEPLFLPGEPAAAPAEPVLAELLPAAAEIPAACKPAVGEEPCKNARLVCTGAGRCRIRGQMQQAPAG